MRLRFERIAGWPKLAWVASVASGSDQVLVRCGAMVETGPDWAAEAVWAGEFAAGDFDQTEHVFGTGVRCRADHVVFVSAGTAMDRLWSVRTGDIWYVSNSLPALCACADASLLEDYVYADDRRGVVRTTWGAETPTRPLPLAGGEAAVTWFDNLEYRGDSLRPVAKVDTTPRFAGFDDYYAFLLDTAERLAANMTDAARANKVTPLTTVSSGYDSCAAAVIAKHAGCTQAVTIRQAVSFWRGSDSGEHVAGRLGLSCDTYDRGAKGYPDEVAVWAGCGYANLLNWTLFDYPQPLSLLFIGCCGDRVWSRERLDGPLLIDNWDDLGMCEFRLIAGMMQCPVAFWGLRRSEDIREITFSPEMAPWTVGGDYDRPIPRRIVEQAGVPRGSFAVRKKNTSHATPFKWPFSRAAQASFRQYLAHHGRFAPAPWLAGLIRRGAWLDHMLHLNVLAKMGLRRWRRPYDAWSGPTVIFRWANEEMQALYRAGLKAK